MARDTTRERGFILAMLLAIIVAMGILLTAALPSLKAEVQRDQEAELIFRGEAMAAGIRAYRAKTGGYPLSLEDLGKMRPPVVRRVYKDPMSREGDWDLITAVQAGASGDTTGLPIVGVKTKVQENSYRIYNGKTLTSDWAFSAAGNLLGVPGAPTAAGVLGAANDAAKKPDAPKTAGSANTGTNP
ncbi:type II secretion system protein [Geothrix sp. 21YS21S-2]|uniref:type II secretion system protein n=1 Tax=Geothrix sp. 21YS21S-2 TaxID=3068893 RepID=UPI0027B9C49E|nr:type II secretion system protein [Geothrix sp. 21YS21S-2]